jgi:hypothetical protein
MVIEETNNAYRNLVCVCLCVRVCMCNDKRPLGIPRRLAASCEDRSRGKFFESRKVVRVSFSGINFAGYAPKMWMQIALQQ